jgi:hypothetical protein
LGGQNGTETDFSPNISIFARDYHSTNAHTLRHRNTAVTRKTSAHSPETFKQSCTVHDIVGHWTGKYFHIVSDSLVKDDVGNNSKIFQTKVEYLLG